MSGIKINSAEQWFHSPLFKTTEFALTFLAGNLTSEQVLEISEFLKSVLESLPKFLVLDCAKVKSLPLKFAGEVVEWNRILAATGRTLLIIKASPDTRNFLENAKLLRTIPTYSDIYHFGKTHHIKEGLRVNYDVADLFSRATSGVLSSILGDTKLQLAFVTLKRRSTAEFISATVPIQGKRIDTHFTIHLPSATFKKVATKILGEEVTEIGDDNRDVACELVNMIFTQAKGLLNGLDYDVQKAFPKLGIDPKLEDRSDVAGQNFILTPFSTPMGNFFTELVF